MRAGPTGREPDVWRRRRGTEAALSRSEARRSAILDCALDAVISIDHRGTILDFNPAAERMFGRVASDVIGLAMVDTVVPHEAREDHARGFAAHLETGRTSILGRRVEVEALRVDGSTLPVELSITRVELDGAPFFTGYLRDLTERRAAECERASLEDQLRETLKMDAVGRLAGGITHDFNNLLAIINGYAEVALEELPAGHAGREALDEIRRAAATGAALTRRLLALGRRQMLRPEDLEIDHVVAAMEPRLRSALGEDIQLVVRLGGHDTRALVDRRQLEQVVMSLAMNAREAMGAGGMLEIETDVVSRRGYVAVRVTDDGPGIDADTLAHVFEPFFTTKSEVEHLGLGLSTVFGIVRQSDGLVTAASDVGAGATFTVLLPVAEG